MKASPDVDRACPFCNGSGLRFDTAGGAGLTLCECIVTRPTTQYHDTRPTAEGGDR